MSPKVLFLSSIGALSGAIMLVSSGSSAIATPVAHRHHHRHVVYRRAYENPEAASPYATGGGPEAYGSTRTPSAYGTPPDNAFDPTRPYGGQSAITAPPGTDAYEEQANERRYFCEFSPSRC